jgi:hypothetical protein
MRRGKKFGGVFAALDRNFDTQDCWVFGLGLLSGILKSTTFRKLDLFPQVRRVGDTYSVESVRKI